MWILMNGERLCLHLMFGFIVWRVTQTITTRLQYGRPCNPFMISCTPSGPWGAGVRSDRPRRTRT